MYGLVVRVRTVLHWLVCSQFQL